MTNIAFRSSKPDLIIHTAHGARLVGLLNPSKCRKYSTGMEFLPKLHFATYTSEVLADCTTRRLKILKIMQASSCSEGCNMQPALLHRLSTNRTDWTLDCAKCETATRASVHESCSSHVQARTISATARMSCQINESSYHNTQYY